MWRQINPVDEKRTAMAPYNFVALPEQVFTVAGDPRFQVTVDGKTRKIWQCHDRFVTPEAHSGWIDLTITTRTPLFIRGAAQHQDGMWDSRESRFRPEAACASDGTPIIPGSSLRGMVRTLVEILGFAKINPVSKQKPFFRTVKDNRIGRAYRDRVVQGKQKPLGGFIGRDGADWVIRESEQVLRVAVNEIPHYQEGSKGLPNWKFQHRTCWVQANDRENVTSLKFEKEDGAGWRQGTLVMTGVAPGRKGKPKREFVFLSPKDASNIPISEELWSRFHDEDQISKWQQDAFPKNTPEGSARRAGHLLEGEPVFFVRDGESLLFFGRAQLFRFPYDLSPADLVPDEHRNAGTDIAEAMFGCVAGREEGVTIKGRLRFEDAIAEPRPDGFFEEIIVPKILSSPKPTAFQQYLVQDGRKPPSELRTYFKDEQTVIRGHKMYWHRWNEARGVEDVREPDRQITPESSTQHTRIRPVSDGVVFRGRIRFDNLSDIELGALLSALRLPDGCAHKLGMAKPLGLGSVAVASTLTLINRGRRYESWQDDGVDSPVSPEAFESAFAEAMVTHAKSSKELLLAEREGLWSIARLDALRNILAFNGRPAVEETRYLRIKGRDEAQKKESEARYLQENEYYEHPVLPTPHGVVDGKDPWADSQPPQPAPQPQHPLRGRSDSSSTTKAKARNERGSSSSRPKQPPIRDEGPRVGQLVRCRLTGEKTKKGGPVFEITALNVEAVLSPSSKALPDGLNVGDEIDLVIKTTTTRPQRFQVAYEPKP